MSCTWLRDGGSLPAAAAAGLCVEPSVALRSARLNQPTAAGSNSAVATAETGDILLYKCNRLTTKT